MSVQKKQTAQHLFEKAPVEQRQTRPRVRNENLMQLTHPLEISLPGVVSEPSVQDDAQLVKASQHGDQHAFAILVQRHQRRVFTMVLRILQDYEEASEITQEAFLAAWQGLPSFRGEARFAIWLYRIAYHCALKQRTYGEMAAILTMPMGTIKTQLVRARHLLKERLSNAFSNAP